MNGYKLHIRVHFHGWGAHLIKRGPLKMPAHYVFGCMQFGSMEVIGGIVLHLKPVAMLKITIGH